MSYQASAELQRAVFAVLSGNAAVQTVIGDAIFDAPPEGTVPEIYALIGEERTLDRSSKTGQAALHDFVIVLRGTGSGFLRIKDAAEAVCDALVGARPVLNRGICCNITYRSGRARRLRAKAGREITLTFRAFIDEI